MLPKSFIYFALFISQVLQFIKANYRQTFMQYNSRKGGILSDTSFQISYLAYVNPNGVKKDIYIFQEYKTYIRYCQKQFYCMQQDLYNAMQVCARASCKGMQRHSVPCYQEIGKRCQQGGQLMLQSHFMNNGRSQCNKGFIEYKDPQAIYQQIYKKEWNGLRQKIDSFRKSQNQIKEKVNYQSCNGQSILPYSEQQKMNRSKYFTSDQSFPDLEDNDNKQNNKQTQQTSYVDNLLKREYGKLKKQNMREALQYKKDNLKPQDEDFQKIQKALREYVSQRTEYLQNVSRSNLEQDKLQTISKVSEELQEFTQDLSESEVNRTTLLDNLDTQADAIAFVVREKSIIQKASEKFQQLKMKVVNGIFKGLIKMASQAPRFVKKYPKLAKYSRKIVKKVIPSLSVTQNGFSFSSRYGNISVNSAEPSQGTKVITAELSGSIPGLSFAKGFDIIDAASGGIKYTYIQETLPISDGDIILSSQNEQSSNVITKVKRGQISMDLEIFGQVMMEEYSLKYRLYDSRNLFDDDDDRQLIIVNYFKFQCKMYDQDQDAWISLQTQVSIQTGQVICKVSSIKDQQSNWVTITRTLKNDDQGNSSRRNTSLTIAIVFIIIFVILIAIVIVVVLVRSRKKKKRIANQQQEITDTAASSQIESPSAINVQLED